MKSVKKDVYSTEQVAHKLGISKRSVYRLIERGVLVAFNVTEGGAIRILRQSYDKFIKDRIKNYQKKHDITVSIGEVEDWQSKNRYEENLEVLIQWLIKTKDGGLSDSYCKNLIVSAYGIKRENVTQEMIALKRLQLTIFRERKKAKQERKVANGFN